MRFRLAISTMVAVLLASCTAMPPPLSDRDAALGTSEYTLAAGDRLKITVFNEPTLTGEYAVSSAGIISFPLIGNVAATSRTLEQFQSALRTELAAGYVNDPRVSVEVLNYRQYYVLGEVGRPGAYPFAADVTLQQAVAVAGGYSYRANTQTLFLKRKGVDGERRVDVRSRDVLVMPGDTIRVGERYF